MKEKSYAIIGLGQFGMTLAKTLAEANYDIMVIDIDNEKVQSIADKVSYAIRADVRETGILEKIGLKDIDVAVIGVSEDKEASMSATMQAKELGIPLVISKAIDDFHGRMLKRLGADQVIFAEKFMGIRVARNLMTSGFLDRIELSSKISMAEVTLPSKWIGKSLQELKLREKYHVNVIGILDGENVKITLDPAKPLKEGSDLIVIADNEALEILNKIY